jgi:DNA-binding Lrp family transcriptional regulator
MAVRDHGDVVLAPDDLNALDEKIIDYLAEEGRASPTLFMRAEDIDTSRQWVSSRFTRLAEHGHIRELHGTGIYEFTNDPRN